MERRGGDLQQRLLTIFRVEAEEHLRELAKELQDLESGREGSERLETVFRAMHSLKGAARAVSLQEFERLAHGAENLLSAMRRKLVPPDHAAIAALIAVVDALQRQVATIFDANAAPGPAVAALLQRIDGLMSPERATSTPTQAPAVASTGDREETEQAPEATAEQPEPVVSSTAAASFVRVATTTLDALWAGTDAFVSARLVADQRLQEIQQLCEVAAAWRSQRQRQRQRVAFRRGSSQRPARRAAGSAEPASMSGDGGSSQRSAIEEEHYLNDVSARLAALQRSLRTDQRHLSGMIEALREGMKDCLMQPISVLIDGLPSVVRELARSEGKEVRLLSQGGDFQVDRRVVDGLRTPLMHLLRNAVHHGIESGAARRATGKDEQGTVRLVASAGASATLELLVEDDGAGVAQAEVLAAAQRMRQLPQAADCSAASALSLIFESGISTSDSIGRISGRGLGLAIAREKIEQLGGSIQVRSEPGMGCSFHIQVPLTLANFRGVLVRTAGRLFILPTAQVRRCLRVDGAQITQIEGRLTVEWMQRVLSLHALSELLGLPASRHPLCKAGTSRLLVLLQAAEMPMVAFEVDEVIAEQEVLLKLLAWPLQRLPHVMGATLLGDGQWVPVLHPADLVRAANGAIRTLSMRTDQDLDPARVPTILVVEDSYTARAMLQAVLESAGYQVLTAVDGVDALQRLASVEVDVLVSDVEMPRLNGFDLSVQVRHTPGLEHLPIILVTALESPEQRARGAEVGANAYLVKSSFDDRNLLDTVAALL